MEHCPDFDERMTLVDGNTRAIAYPQPGYNCNPAYSIAQPWVTSYNGTDIAGIGADVGALEHCPDFDERWTLKDGLTRGIPYPQTGYNCNSDYAIVQH